MRHFIRFYSIVLLITNGLWFRWKLFSDFRQIFISPKINIFTYRRSRFFTRCEKTTPEVGNTK